MLNFKAKKKGRKLVKVTLFYSLLYMLKELIKTGQINFPHNSVFITKNVIV